jgi:adhesin/invasin
MGVSIRTGKALVATASLALLGACGDKVNVNVVSPFVATSLTVVSGSGQTGTAGAALADPIVVRVLDQNGFALPNAVVTWTPAANSGSVSSVTSTSDINGDASITWTLGTAAGSDTLVASLANGATATITADAVAGAFNNLTLVSGDNQTVAAGAATQPMIVRAVDANGNPVAGALVTWASTGGGTLSATSTTTDATGSAQVTLTTSANPGAYTVTASSGAAPSITFNGSGV